LTILFAARVTSSVNSRVRKIGVSEIRKSAGHFSVSFTQRTNAAYLSRVKSALNIERSCGSTVSIRYNLVAVWLFDHAVNVAWAENGRSAFVIYNNDTIPARRDESVIDCRN
jgi:hypothetical protein